MMRPRIASLPLSVLLYVAAAALHAQPIPCDEVAELNPVFFPFMADTLDADGRVRLDENLDLVLRHCPEWGVLVAGYTDGDEQNRQILSRRRAEVVARYYLDHEIEAGRIAVQGRGKHPNAFSEGDPGPGDRNARRTDSLPLALADLPAAPTLAAPLDPPPYTEAITYDIAFTVDWAPDDGRAGGACPETAGDSPDRAPMFVLQEAVLDIEGEAFVLDTACLRTTDPLSTLYDRRVAEVRPGVYVVEGLLFYNARVSPIGWMVGPEDHRRTDGLFCATYANHARTIDARLLGLAEARATQTATTGAEQDAAQAHAVLETQALGEAADALLPYLETVRAVGGTLEGIGLDCTPIRDEPHYH